MVDGQVLWRVFLLFSPCLTATHCLLRTERQHSNGQHFHYCNHQQQHDQHHFATGPSPRVGFTTILPSFRCCQFRLLAEMVRLLCIKVKKDGFCKCNMASETPAGSSLAFWAQPRLLSLLRSSNLQLLSQPSWWSLRLPSLVLPSNMDRDNPHTSVVAVAWLQAEWQAMAQVQHASTHGPSHPRPRFKRRWRPWVLTRSTEAGRCQGFARCNRCKELN